MDLDRSAHRADTNRLIAYHSHISGTMTAERTALESALIPVVAYIVISAAECWYRHPDICHEIGAAMDPYEIGRAGRRPGSNVNAVYLWSTANIFLTGRKALTTYGLAKDDSAGVREVLTFWERAAQGFHDGSGSTQAWDDGLRLTPYGPEIIDALMESVEPVDDPEQRLRIKRFSATLMSYLFLLYFDTRVGTGDTGPYELPDGRVLLVRDFYKLGRSDFWWSDVATEVPYSSLTCALVLDGVHVKVNDWGTTITDPEDYLDHLVGFGLYTTDTPDGTLRAIPQVELPAILSAVRKAQSQHYRNVAGMSRDEKIRCGAYVYFTFPRPLAEVAGIADKLDWDVPKVTKEVLPDVGVSLYDAFSGLEGGNDSTEVEGQPYYAPLAEEV